MRKTKSYLWEKKCRSPNCGICLVYMINYNNTEDIPRLYRRRGICFRSVGVQSPTERKQFFELPLLVKSRALNTGGKVLKLLKE